MRLTPSITTTRISVKKITATILLLGAVAAAATVAIKDYDQKKAREALITQMKNRGCVADGLLFGPNKDTLNSIALVERSECQYLHRAIETWVTPPDFTIISKNLNLAKKKFIWGMFLAEAIGIKSHYFYPEENREFNFSQMCQESSEGFWGEGTCKANFSSEEYRKYLRFITRQAIDLGIQSFLFGQIFFQDKGTSSDAWAPKIVKEMNDYASSKGKTIVIGAQTNSITNEKYLKTFDYIEGGLGMDDDGKVESGACLKGLWKKNGGGCWALLWHKDYAAKANNVLLNLDWSGLNYDDMSRFARMSSEKRAKTLKTLYRFFTSQNVGFMMPMLSIVDDQNKGCYGPSPEFYSADNKYSCKDEGIINAILTESGTFSNAQFISEDVPTLMKAGKKYDISITLKNVGNSVWTKNKKFQLGPQNPPDNSLWGKRVDLGDKEEILPGAEKKFTFSVIAPILPGTYNFQWRMQEEKGGWFGDNTEKVKILVTP